MRRSCEDGWSNGVPIPICDTWTRFRISTQANHFCFASLRRVALVIEVEKARYTKLPFEHPPPE
jgi:hypothetical protein